MGLPGADRQPQLSWAWYRAQRDGHKNTKAFRLKEHKMLLQNCNCLAKTAQVWSYLIFQEAASHGSSILSKYVHLAPVIQPHLLHIHVSTTTITQLSSRCNAHFMQQRISKSSKRTKVALPLGSDKEGKRFFLPRQMACVKDHAELVLRKEKAVFRDIVYCFKMYFFWNFT